MKTWVRFWFFLLSATIGFASNAGAQSLPDSPQYHTNRIIIKPVFGDVANFQVGLGSPVLKSFPRLNGIQVVQVPNGFTVDQTIAAYKSSGLVQYAERDNLRTGGPATYPNDPYFMPDHLLWGLYNWTNPGKDIHAPEAWYTLHDASDVVVAVIDSGVRYTHSDLTNNMWVNSREIPGNGIDDDNDGYIDDVHGINSLTGSGNPDDDAVNGGHGTAIAGILGAEGDNNLLVVGVAWHARIMAAQVFFCKML